MSKQFYMIFFFFVLVTFRVLPSNADCPDFYAAPTTTWTLDAAAALSTNCALCPLSTLATNATNINTTSTRPPHCACAAGTFLANTSCLSCPTSSPDHAYCPGGRTAPTPCPPHRLPTPTATACHCGAGLLDHPTDSTTCEPCPSTHYCPGHGLPAQLCPSNHHVRDLPGIASSNCTCVPGTAFNAANATCDACAPGTICPGHLAPGTSCPLHSTSPPRSSTTAACVCLPPFTRGALASTPTCEQLPTRAAALYLSETDLAELSGGAGVTVIPGQGCAPPAGKCSTHLDVHVHSPTHLTLLAHNLVIEPAYLGLLFAVLEGADITAMHYTTTQTLFSSKQHSNTPAWKCTADITTEAAFLQDPAAQHTAAAEASWDAVLRADAALAGRAWVRTDAVHVQLTTSAMANASDFTRCGFGPLTVDQAGQTLTLGGAACPTDAALACALASGTVQGLTCHSQQVLVVAGHSAPTTLPPAFSCTSGYVEQRWNHTTMPTEAEAFARRAHASDTLVFGPHLLGRIDVTLADHAHTEDMAFSNANHSRWVQRVAPVRTATSAGRWFAALHVPAPVFLPEQAATVHVSLDNTSTPRVRLDVQGLLLARHDTLDILRALRHLADHSPPPTTFVPDAVIPDILPGEILLNSSSENNRVTVFWSEHANATAVLSDATRLNFGGNNSLPAHSVLRFLNQTWRPLGHLVDTATAGSGVLHALGTAGNVRAGLLDLHLPAPPRANVTRTLAGGANATCDGGQSTFTLHTVLEAVVEPLFLTRMVQQVLLRLLLAPGWEAHSHATLATLSTSNTTRLHVATAVPTAQACSRGTVRNPAFTDADLTAALAALVPLPPGQNVQLTSRCVHDCTAPEALSVEHAASTAPAETTVAWHTGLVASDRLAAVLHQHSAVVFPHLTVAQTFLLDTPDAAAVVAAAQAVQFGDAARLPNLRAAAGGLALVERPAHTGWGGVSVLAAGPGCLRVRARNEAIHVQDLVQAVRAAHAVEAPVRVAAEQVQAELAAAPGTVGEDHAQILALQRAGIDIEVSQAQSLYLARATLTWPDARFAPNVTDVLEIAARAAVAAVEVEAVHVFATVWLRVGVMSLTLAQLEMLRGDIEVALDDALGFSGNQVLGFDTSPAMHSTEYEFAMHMRLRAVPDCQHMPKALYHALHAEESWLRTWDVTAKVAEATCRAQLAATGWATGALEGVWEAVRGRAICTWNACNLSVHDAGPEVIDTAHRVNVTAPDVAAWVAAVDVVLGPPPRAALGVALAVFFHDVTVCGVEDEDKVVDALAPYFGKFVFIF